MLHLPFQCWVVSMGIRWKCEAVDSTRQSRLIGTNFPYKSARLGNFSPNRVAKVC